MAQGATADASAMEAENESLQCDVPSLFPERARWSCIALQAEEHLPARLDRAAAQRFADQLDVNVVKEKGSSLALDSNATRVDASFSSVDEEAALICLMHALDFGGGWRQELHAFGGQGAWATVKPGVEQLYRAAPDLPAAWLSTLSLGDVARLFAMEGEKAAPLAPFIGSLHMVCNEIGTSLLKEECSTVGAFLSRSLSRHGASSTPAALLVRDLVEAFPLTFDDRHCAKGRDVFFYKKAQLVVGELYHRFRKEDPRFSFPDGDRLTAFIDNVICAVLRKDGVVSVTEELAEAIDSHRQLPSGSLEEVSLRAAAMAGVEEVVRCVRASGRELTQAELGNYLWGVLGKVPDYRKFTRHATKDTVFY